ncbi:MAG: hypothetical protein IRZ00_08285 [Gemmatimonadetes bacterium]|nr:hypothetical protein [Gemmatimonadota bacterium]
MNPVRLLRSSGILATLALAVACSRPVAVESEPGPVYTLEVVNPSNRDMSVSYETGGVPTTLGQVNANETRRFVVRQPGMLTITVVGTEDGTGRVVRREVTLRAGSVVSVRLGP